MGCVFGRLFTVTIFGESHSAGLGAVLGGLPAGIALDLDAVRAAMQRRAPTTSAASTSRREADEFEILSGYWQGHTTGTPLAAIVRNTDTRSQDYLRTAQLLRPGHADYTGFVKYNGFGDIRGGGHFSGRITASLVFAGAIARQVLAAQGMVIGAHIKSVSDVPDAPFSEFTEDELLATETRTFPTLDRDAGRRMLAKIEEAKNQLDSLGGIIECAVAGVPAGLGEPFFDSAESVLAHLLFSIPAVKGVEFGDGFALAGMHGSEANDHPTMQDGKVVFDANHSGGINGGITNGMPLVFRVVIRPTSSIAQAQNTVNIAEMKDDVLNLHGRHDACIVPRAVEVVKSAAAIVLLDLLMQEKAVDVRK